MLSKFFKYLSKKPARPRAKLFKKNSSLFCLSLMAKRCAGTRLSKKVSSQAKTIFVPSYLF